MNRAKNMIIGGLTFSVLLLSYVVYYDTFFQKPFASKLSDDVAYENTDRFDYSPDKSLPDYPKELEEERRRTFVPYEESHRKYLEDTRMPDIDKHHDFLMHDHPLQEEPLQEKPIQ